jgi:hypothetical protein
MRSRRGLYGGYFEDYLGACLRPTQGLFEMLRKAKGFLKDLLN